MGKKDAGLTLSFEKGWLRVTKKKQDWFSISRFFDNS